MGKPLADPEAVRAENMRLRAEGTIVVTKRALAAAKPRSFVEFAEKTLALEEWARRFNARGLTFRLFGAPRTKKNHSRLKWAPKKKRTVLVPSAAYEEWCNHVCVQLATCASRCRTCTTTAPPCSTATPIAAMRLATTKDSPMRWRPPAC
jgi:hypothetical protein